MQALDTPLIRMTSILHPAFPLPLEELVLPHSGFELGDYETLEPGVPTIIEFFA